MKSNFSPAITNRPLPSPFRSGFTRSIADTIAYFQRFTSMVFGFCSPVIFMLIFGFMYGSNEVPAIGKISHLIVAGSVATSVVTICLTSTAIAVASDRQYGILKRLATTPFTPVSYMVCRAFYSLILTVILVVIVMICGSAFFQSPLPDSGLKWITFIGVLLAGMLTTTLIGIFLGYLARNSEIITTVIVFPFVILQFISGIFYPMSLLAQPLQIIGSIFPLKWIAQGVRFSILPDSAKAGEVGGQWDLGYVFLVLAGWAVFGLVTAILAYRWRHFDK